MAWASNTRQATVNEVWARQYAAATGWSAPLRVHLADLAAYDGVFRAVVGMDDSLNAVTLWQQSLEGSSLFQYDLWSAAYR